VKCIALLHNIIIDVEGLHESSSNDYGSLDANDGTQFKKTRIHNSVTATATNLSSNLLWLITSYALERSRKMPTTYKCLSRASWTLCINERLAVSVDLHSVNPCCSLHLHNKHKY